MSEAFLRPATQADALLVLACVRAAFECYIERIGKPPAAMLEDYARVIAERNVTVAICGASVVGVLVVGPADEGFRLFTIAVHPSFQKQGLGRRLLRLAESEAAREGHDCIHLQTNVKMTENQVLYANLGYVEYDRRIEDGYSRIFMRKVLP